MKLVVPGSAFLFALTIGAANAACTPPSGSSANPVAYSGVRGGPTYVATGSAATSSTGYFSQTLIIKFTAPFGSSFTHEAPPRVVGAASLVTKNSTTYASTGATGSTSEQFTPYDPTAFSLPRVAPAQVRLVEWDATECTGYLELLYQAFQISYSVNGSVIDAAIAITPSETTYLRRQFLFTYDKNPDNTALQLQSITYPWQFPVRSSDLQTVAAVFELKPR